jgi:Exostosin family
MKLMVTTTDINNTDYGLDFVNWIRQSAVNCPFKMHVFTESLEDADAILFINRGRDYNKLLQENPILKKHICKSFLYESSDSPIDFLPGVYVAMPKRSFNHKRHRVYSYLTPINEFIEQYSINYKQAPDLLFSFMGAATSPVRKTLFRKQLFMKHPDVVIENTSSWSNWDTNHPLRHERTKRYAEILARSKFVLCPRGGATASYRLFETMQMGRVPIIIADDWVAPASLCWSEFSIRVPEGKIAHIPQLLTEYQDRYDEMGKRARQVWEDWFSPNVQFHRLAESISELINQGCRPSQFDRYRWPFLVSAWQIKRGVRSAFRSLALASMKVIQINPYLAMPPNMTANLPTSKLDND